MVINLVSGIFAIMIAIALFVTLIQMVVEYLFSDYKMDINKKNLQKCFAVVAEDVDAENVFVDDAVSYQVTAEFLKSMVALVALTVLFTVGGIILIVS